MYIIALRCVTNRNCYAKRALECLTMAAMNWCHFGSMRHTRFGLAKQTSSNYSVIMKAVAVETDRQTKMNEGPRLVHVA